MKVNVDFRNNQVLIVGANPSGPNPAIGLTNAQAISLARAILTKLDRNILRDIESR